MRASSTPNILSKYCNIRLNKEQIPELHRICKDIQIIAPDAIVTYTDNKFNTLRIYLICSYESQLNLKGFSKASLYFK